MEANILIIEIGATGVPCFGSRITSTGSAFTLRSLKASFRSAPNGRSAAGQTVVSSMPDERLLMVGRCAGLSAGAPGDDAAASEGLP